MTIVFSIPTPPSTNNLFATVRGGRRVRSKAYNAWLAEAGWEIKRQRVPSVAGPVSVTLTIRKPTGVRVDLDGKLKSPLDLLVKQHILADDSQVHEITARWGVVEGCCVEIREMGE
jgi:Holliday junction resolvase RusA-like endonuclease